MYAVPQKDMADVRRLGIDFVVGPGDRNYLDQAAAASLKVLARGGTLQKHPALLGSYLTDEPDLRDIEPSVIATEFHRLKKSGAQQTYLNVSSAGSIEAYSPYCDVIMFDWYPVGWQPIETFWSHLRVARLASHGKPFIAVVQAFSWANYPQLMPPSATYRSPTAEEVRAMAIWAAMNGATGIAFYAYNDNHTSLPTTSEPLRGIKEAIETIRQHESEFYGSRSWAPYPFQFVNKTETYNRIFDVSIPVKYVKIRNTNHLRLIAANTTEKSISVNFAKNIVPVEGEASVLFAPFEVKFFTVAIHNK
jgi:hypothetical protein